MKRVSRIIKIILAAVLICGISTIPAFALYDPVPLTEDLTVVIREDWRQLISYLYTPDEQMSTTLWQRCKHV